MKITAKTVIFLGTGSDVGKSVVTTAFCRVLKRKGYSVAPFKAQNMSNNSYITLEGGEIGRAQVVQAEACGLEPGNDMNPVLLKPSSGVGAQVVVQGRVYAQMQAKDYQARKKHLARAVMESFHRLASAYDVVVLEGAGSCCEVNLRANDLVNFAMAKKAQAPCVLVADIDRGGVFAQIIGSMHLMTPSERKLTAGFIVNKFRGDIGLFRDGVDFIERKTARPVFGVLPYYRHIRIDPEDSVAVQADKRPVRDPRPDRLNVAVVHLPSISNFTDMEALEGEPDVLLNYLSSPSALSPYDLLVIPGAKNTMEDAVWLAETGWKDAVRSYAESGGFVLGVCGGYQLLGRTVLDPLGVESSRREAPGLGLLPLATTMAGDKVLRRVEGVDLRNGLKVQGYEIHMGRTERSGEPAEAEPFLELNLPQDRTSWQDGWRLENGRVMGTYLHGLLDAPQWRNEFLNRIRRGKGLPEMAVAADGRGDRFRQYDLLADHFEKHVDVGAIMNAMGL